MLEHTNFGGIGDEASAACEAKVLSHGVDTLDLGLFIAWDYRWPKLAAALERGKRKAAGSEGILFGDGRCLIGPSGKKPCYRWHLQYPLFHAFYSKQLRALGQTPNVYVSLNSELLWREGVRGAVAHVCRELQALGGETVSVKVSRCDPCVDVLIPGGLSLAFIEAHRVPLNRQENPHTLGGVLQTFYHGAKGSDIQLRIYDKSLEIRANGGKKRWFFDVWGLPECDDVWRIEFELRRPVLKQFGIHTLDDLSAKLPGLWAYLTGDWVSLRNPDNANATRRTIHPLWQLIQSASERFGQLGPVERRKTAGEIDLKGCLSRLAGYLTSYAACRGVSDLDVGLRLLRDDLCRYFQHRDFGEAVRIKAIRQGREAA